MQVEDTGIGIKESDQNKLFKLYGYMDCSKELNTKGIGLGLFICKKIVQVYDGYIQCFSQFGKGSNFVMLLPLGKKKTNQNGNFQKVG